MAINDVTKFTATFIGYDGQEWQWVWHYIQTAGGAVSNTAYVDAVEAMLALAWAEIEDFVSTAVIGETLQLAVWDDVLKEFNTIRTNDISALVGAGAADGNPANVAPVVSFPTAVGRSIGKKFLFGILESALSNGALLSGILAGAALFALEFVDVITQGGNSFAPGNFNLETETFRQWLGTEVRIGLFSGSQYRRLPGRGA